MQMVLALIIAVVMDFWTQLSLNGGFLESCRSVNWLRAYTNKMGEWISKTGIDQGYFVAISLFVPLAIGILLLNVIFDHLLRYIGGFLFITLTLYYFLGNSQIEEHTSDYVIAHERSFGILFWFALLGPVGALLYWFLVVSIQQADPKMYSADTLAALTRLHAIAAWIPARITGFIYALVGNFTAGFNCWLNCMRNPSMPSSEILTECGTAAVDANIAQDHTNLVTRAFIAWVVLSILIVVFK